MVQIRIFCEGWAGFFSKLGFGFFIQRSDPDPGKTHPDPHSPPFRKSSTKDWIDGNAL